LDALIRYNLKTLIQFRASSANSFIDSPEKPGAFQKSSLSPTT